MLARAPSRRTETAPGPRSGLERQSPAPSSALEGAGGAPPPRFPIPEWEAVVPVAAPAPLQGRCGVLFQTEIQPFLYAANTACTRVRTPSRRLAASMCSWTVLWDTPSSTAISQSDFPNAT